MAKARFGDITNSMEGNLPEEYEQGRPKLRLKNGSEVDARIAYVTWRMLEAVETRRPTRLKALVAIARGQENSVASEMRNRLREEYLNWFKDGQMEPIVRDVIQSAIRDTPDGSLLVEPFQLTNQAELETLKKIQRQDDEVLKQLFRRNGGSHGNSIS